MADNSTNKNKKAGIGEITQNFQVSIPSEVRKKLKLKIGDCLAFVEKNGEIIISKAIEISQLDDLIQDLITIALQDGEITKEEKEMIKSIYENIATFKQAYRKAWEDEIITPEEKSLLTHLWKRIYDKTAESVKKDKKITLDEIKLLMSVFKTIHQSTS
ncbi:MAG: AbrB/MazE/SpoVT family DNA-binding domain-containing protein [Candidatus Hodarchaeales archaeon]|jgi:AbrB family looped-hinge helix DNA binding protein